MSVYPVVNVDITIERSTMYGIVIPTFGSFMVTIGVGKDSIHGASGIEKSTMLFMGKHTNFLWAMFHRYVTNHQRVRFVMEWGKHMGENICGQRNHSSSIHCF